MHIICLTPVEEGVYNDHKADHIVMPPNGWACIPDGFPLPSTFPRLGGIEAEEMTYTREVEGLKEVTKTREVESYKEVVKTREVEVWDKDGKPYTITEEYTELEPVTVTEEYTVLEPGIVVQEYTMLTVVSMTEGTLPEPVEPEAKEPTTEEILNAMLGVTE